VAATFGTAAILYIDRQAIRNSVQERRTDSGESFLEKPRTMGKGAFAPSLALISYGASFATHDDREKETAVLLLESMAFTGVLVGLGQFVLSSERPDEGNAVHFFQWGGHGVSGDAGLAASVVPVLKNQYLRVHPGDGGGLRVWKRTATGFLYAGAVLTGYQRIYSDKHWAPDAFLGLVSGFTAGQILCDSHDKAREEARSHATMMAIPGGVGVKWTF
jgi:membrane-associated phospholipid phosphatase